MSKIFRDDATGEKKILPDTRFAEVVKFLRYWQGHAEYDALVTEQLHIVAKEAVQAWLSETRAIDREAIEIAAQTLEYIGGMNNFMVANDLRKILEATPSATPMPTVVGVKSDSAQDSGQPSDKHEHKYPCPICNGTGTQRGDAPGLIIPCGPCAGVGYMMPYATPSATRWIFVADKLPEPRQKVFFMARGSTGIHAGHMDDKGRWWCFAASDQWPSKPLLWMPAPLPPASLVGPHEPPKPPNHFPVA